MSFFCVRCGRPFAAERPTDLCYPCGKAQADLNDDIALERLRGMTA